jgi:hypothetical protein
MKRPEPIIFVLPQLPTEPHDCFRIRLLIPGIDEGSSVCLDARISRKSLAEANVLAEQVAAAIKGGLEFLPQD